MKIAITGKMRSGKDTLAKIIIAENTSVIPLAFGDGIKHVANVYFPEIVAKGKPRKLYQFIGQMFREMDKDIWVKDLKNQMTYYIHEDGFSSFVVTDVRQMNEYEFLKENGFVVIKVEADDELRRERILNSGDVLSELEFTHDTETAVDSIPYDYLLTNNTTLEDFMTQIDFVLAEILGDKSHE